MDVSISHSTRHSERDFSEQLMLLTDAGAGVIHVRAAEVLRATSVVRKAALLDNGTYSEWDIVNGTREFTREEINNESKNGDGNSDIGATFQEPLGVIRDQVAPEAGRMRYFVYVNPHPFMENNPHMQQLLLMYNEFLPACGACVILITPDQPLPEGVAGDSILSIRFLTPSLNELRTNLSENVEHWSTEFSEGTDLDEEAIDRVCYTGAGMTRLQFETHTAIAVARAGLESENELTESRLCDQVRTGKTEIVNGSDILELYPPSSIDDVGGMENLKTWVSRRSNCYSEEAKEFGIESPKGMVLVGPPGTGKSLVAKAISSVLGVPLVRLDFGRVFSSFVGSSEQRIRSALHMVESMSPCVLFCDEIDKGLGGIAGGGGSDSGVSMRVLGSFLTWLQDCKYPVFTMVTANNIDGLPPELMRRGRFDAIFSTSMPDADERREVLRIHLAKRGRDLDDYPEDEVQSVIDACNNYVPAEIEAAVKDALVDAFNLDEELAMSHILNALMVMVPLSKAFAQQIKRMDDWAKDNATPVSAKRDRSKVVAMNRRRTSTRNRTGDK